MIANSLSIKNLVVSLKSDAKKILNGVSLSVKTGEIHAVMGPNGAGKTTLALALMGHPGYKLKVESSKLRINGKDLVQLLPEERARLGLFVSFQSPVEITGVSVLSFLRTAHKALYPDKKIPLSEFKITVKKALQKVGLSEEFISRYLNEGFSGGEKKRMEVAQLLVLRPSFAVLDEIDSGLDIDSMKVIAAAIKSLTRAKTGIILITHYQSILHYLNPDKVHVMINGKIRRTDGMKLVQQIEKKGYAAI